jgi:hypothetical protein
MTNLTANVTAREAWNLNGWFDRAFLFVFPALAVLSFAGGESLWGWMNVFLTVSCVYELFLTAAAIKWKNEAERLREIRSQPNVTVFKDGMSIADCEAELVRQQTRESLRWTNGR